MLKKINLKKIKSWLLILVINKKTLFFFHITNCATLQQSKFQYCVTGTSSFLQLIHSFPTWGSSKYRNVAIQLQEENSSSKLYQRNFITSAFVSVCLITGGWGRSSDGRVSDKKCRQVEDAGKLPRVEIKCSTWVTGLSTMDLHP